MCHLHFLESISTVCKAHHGSLKCLFLVSQHTSTSLHSKLSVRPFYIYLKKAQFTKQLNFISWKFSFWFHFSTFLYIVHLTQREGRLLRLTTAAWNEDNTLPPCTSVLTPAIRLQPWLLNYEPWWVGPAGLG